MNCSETCREAGSFLVPVWRSDIRHKNTINITDANHFISQIKNQSWRWNHLQLCGKFPHEALIFTTSDDVIIIYDSYIDIRNREARMYGYEEFTLLINGLFSSNTIEQRNAYNMLFNVQINNDLNISSISIFPLK
jgi:hypothetical protein